VGRQLEADISTPTYAFCGQSDSIRLLTSAGWTERPAQSKAVDAVQGLSETSAERGVNSSRDRGPEHRIRGGLKAVMFRASPESIRYDVST